MIRPWLLAVLGFLLAATSGAAETGDALCDGATSTADTCVIAGAFVVPDSAVLAFTSPNVEIRGSITVQFQGRCALDSTPCASDADCASGPCGRTGRVTVQATGQLLVDKHAGATVAAVGHAATGDVVGADGGTIAL